MNEYYIAQYVMKKKNNNKRNRECKLNIKLIIYGIILVLLTISNIFLIVNLIKLNNIETILKIIVIISLIIINIFFIVRFILLKKKKRITISLIVMTILFLLISFLNYTFQKVYNVFDDIAKNYEEYTLSLVTLSSNSIDNISGIDDNIGVIEDENIDNGYKFAQKIIEKNNITQELIKYETYLNIVEDLYNEKIKYAFLPSNYVSMFYQDEKYANIEQKLKVIHNDSKKVEVELVDQDVNEPFSILLMGVDTLNSSYNADTLLLVTFNPDTLGATMLSIPRDTYTKIACTGGKHKINSSGWYSDKCVVDTVSNLVDIDIDYYVKINFTGIVELVDAIGGIDVDVVYPFCEQNSKRQFGNNLIYVEEGFQHLNGEQALALSRNRKFLTGQCPSKYNEKGYYDNNLRNDITRGLNQQLVLKGILNSLTQVRDLNTVYDLLDVVSDNISTNMSKDTILSFYNIFKNIVTTSDLSNIENTFDIQKLSISVYGTYINISGMDLSMIIPHQNSINAISAAMKENLGLKEKEMIKTFKFNINEPYEETTIGSDITGGTSLSLLKDMVGKEYNDVKSYCDSINKNCEFEYVEINDDSYSNNEIIEQSIPANYDLSVLYKPIVFKVAKVTNNPSTNLSFDYSLCIKKEYKDNKNCQIPNFTNKNLADFNNWYKNFGFITVKLKKVEDNAKSNNLIIKQSIFSKSIYELYVQKETIEIDYIYNSVSDNDNANKEENKTEQENNQNSDNNMTEENENNNSEMPEDNKNDSVQENIEVSNEQ